MEDQRLEPRTHLIYYLRVYHPDDGQLFGHVVDISKSGMLITSEKPMQKNSHYRLFVENASAADDSETVEVDLECRWCESDPDNILFDAGFRLLNPNPKVNQVFAAYQ